MYLDENENYRIFYPQKNLNFKFTVFEYNSNDFEIGISGNDYLFFKFKSGIIKDFKDKVVGNFNNQPVTVDAYLKDGLFDYYINNKEIAREYSVNPTSVFSSLVAKIFDATGINLQSYIYGSDAPNLSFLKFYSNESVSGKIVNNGNYKVKIFSAESPNTSGNWIFPEYLIPGEIYNFFNYDISGYSNGDLIFLNLNTSFGDTSYSLQIRNDGAIPTPDDGTTIEEPVPLAYTSVNLISGQLRNFELSTGLYRIDYQSTLTNAANLTFEYTTGKFFDLEVSKTLDYPLIYQGTLLGEGDGKGSGTLFPTKEPKSEFHFINARNQKNIDFYLSGDSPKDFEDIYLTGKVTLGAQLSQLKVDIDDNSLFSNNSNEYLIDYGGKYLPLQNFNLSANPNRKYSYLTRFLTSNITGDASITFTGEIPDSSYLGKYTFLNPQSSQKDPFLINQKIQQTPPEGLTLKPYRGVAFAHLTPSNSNTEFITIYGFTPTNNTIYESKFVDSWQTSVVIPFWIGPDSPYLSSEPAGSTGGGIIDPCAIDIHNAATVIEDENIFALGIKGGRVYEAYLTGCNLTGCFVSGTNCFITGDFSIRTYPDPQIQPLQSFQIPINSNPIIFYKNLPNIDFNGEFIFNLNSGYLTGLFIPTQNSFCQRRNSSFSFSSRDEAGKIIDQMVADSSRAYLSLSPFENIKNTIETFSIYSNDSVSSSIEKNYTVDWNGNNFICLLNDNLDNVKNNIGYFDDVFFFYSNFINYIENNGRLDAKNLIYDSWDGLKNYRYLLSNITLPQANTFFAKRQGQRYIYNHIMWKFDVNSNSKISIPFFSQEIGLTNYIFSFVTNLEEGKYSIKLNNIIVSPLFNEEGYYTENSKNYKRKYCFLNLKSKFSLIEISFTESISDIEMGALMIEKKSNLSVPSDYEQSGKQSDTVNSVLLKELTFQYFTFRLAGKKGFFGKDNRGFFKYIVYDDRGDIINPDSFAENFWIQPKEYTGVTGNGSINQITVPGVRFKYNQPFEFISIQGSVSSPKTRVIYYVRGAGSTFEIAESKNGVAIDISDFTGGVIREKNAGLIKDFFDQYIFPRSYKNIFLCERGKLPNGNLDFLSIKKINSDLYVDGSKIDVRPSDSFEKTIVLNKISNFFTDYVGPLQGDFHALSPKTFYIGANKIFRRIYGEAIPIEYENKIIKANIQAGFVRYYDENSNDGFFWTTENFYTVRNSDIFGNEGSFLSLSPNFEKLNTDVKLVTSQPNTNQFYNRLLKTSGNIGMHFPTNSPGQTVYLTRAEMSIPYGENSTWTGLFENFEKKTSDVWDLRLSDDREGSQNVNELISEYSEYVDKFRLEGIGNSDNDGILTKTKYLTVKNKWENQSGIPDEGKITFDITNSQKEVIFSSEVNIP